ncbi:hypothetical protein [Amycolatopsis sp. NPDC052450]|uniref:hypothetical protein n=1 Tax=Amycolatopsis sp. NPDC052450 TaxID=3363937 RepID=UPI0037C70E69
MGYDAYGAVVEWEPLLALTREPHWDHVWLWDDAEEPMAPFLSVDDMPGTKGHWNSLWYYGDCLRPRLTPETRALADTVLGTLTTGYVSTEEWEPERRDDLAADAGPHAQPAPEDWRHLLNYTLRPAGVRELLDAAHRLPWDLLTRLGEECDAIPQEQRDPPHGAVLWFHDFRYFTFSHIALLEQAAAGGHGVVTIGGW